MKKYKEDIKTIFQVLSLIAIYFFVVMEDDPIISSFCGTFCILVWFLNIIDKIKYRKNYYKNEIRFPTQNDAYFKMTSLILGTMIVIGSIIWLILLKEITPIPMMGLLVGGLILINGLIDLPKGQIKIENSKIRLNGQLPEVRITEVESIEIQPDRLVIYSIDRKQIKQDKLELTEKWISQIADFLKRYLNTEKVEIKMR